MNSRETVKRITLIAILTVIVFVMEEVLTLIPGVQLTVFLLFLYSKKLKFHESVIIVALHTLLDNIFLMTLDPRYMLAMFIGWLLIPILTNLLFKKVENPILLAFISCPYAVLYCIACGIGHCLIAKADFGIYMLADIAYEIPLLLSSFISTLILYKPLSTIFDKHLMYK